MLSKVGDSAIIPGWRAPALIAMMTSLTAVSYFDRTILSIAGPQLMREFHISPTAMGTVYSALLLSYTLCMLPGGALVDRFSPGWYSP
jgi:MFS family permease